MGGNKAGFLKKWKTLDGYSHEYNDRSRGDSAVAHYYTCTSENERFKSLKDTFTIDHTAIGELVIFLKQVDPYTKWQYNMFLPNS